MATLCRWVHVLTTRYTFVNTLQLLGRDPRLDSNTQVTLAVHARELGLPSEPRERRPELPLSEAAAGPNVQAAAAREAAELSAQVLAGEGGLSHRVGHEQTVRRSA